MSGRWSSQKTLLSRKTFQELSESDESDYGSEEKDSQKSSEGSDNSQESSDEGEAYRPRRQATRGLSRHLSKRKDDEDDEVSSDTCGVPVIIIDPPPDQHMPMEGTADNTWVPDTSEAQPPTADEDVFRICPPPATLIEEELEEHEIMPLLPPPPAFMEESETIAAPLAPPPPRFIEEAKADAAPLVPPPPAFMESRQGQLCPPSPTPHPHQQKPTGKPLQIRLRRIQVPPVLSHQDMEDSLLSPRAGKSKSPIHHENDKEGLTGGRAEPSTVSGSARKVLNTTDVYTSTETEEDTSGDDTRERPKRKLPLREEEVVMEGLLGHTKAPCLEVVDFGPPKGRGVVAKQPIQKGQYVCEYRTYRVYPVGSDEAKSLAQEYDLNDEGSYILETSCPVPGVGHRLAFDATRRFKDLGRLINHRAIGYNLKPCRPTYIRNKWRVGMIAVRHIPVNQELTYDYGTRTESWMRVRHSGWENGAEGRENRAEGGVENGDEGGENGAEGGGNWAEGEESGGAEKDRIESQMLVGDEGGEDDGENGAEGRENVSEGEENDGAEEDSTRVQSEKPLWEEGTEGGENRSENNRAEEDIVDDVQVLDEGAEGEESGSENDGAEKMLVWEEGGENGAEDGENGAEGLENVSEGEENDGADEDSTRVQSEKLLWEEGAEGGENRSENDRAEEDMVGGVQEEGKILPKARAKRNYFWCPMPDCMSGPVQKITQHLQKKHKLPATKAATLATKKRRAPVEAIRLKSPNPYTRSSGMKNLALTLSSASDSRPSPGHRLDVTPVSKAPKTPSTSRKPPQTSPTTTPTSWKPAHPVAPCTPSTSGLSGNFHHDGEFLKAFHSHLKTRAGGLRGEQATKQICRYVGKYLHFLNPSTVEESSLLDPAPVQGYLDAVQAIGIGSSGVLYRILAHKAAVNFMRLTMDDDSELRRVEKILWHLSQVEKTFKVEKHKDARDLLLHQSLDGGAESMLAIQHFKQDPKVLHVFLKEARIFRQGHMSRPRYNTCLGLLTARLMYCNAQRPSAITGMARSELDDGLQKRRLGDTERAVVVVKNHKTGRKEAALIVVDGQSVRMALLWFKILELTQPESNLAFPDFHGGEIQHLERKIHAAVTPLGHALPTATAFRKSLEIKNKRLAGPMREAVSRALSHSLGTAQQYYQAPTLSDAYAAYSVMQDIIGGARAASPVLEDRAQTWPEQTEPEDNMEKGETGEGMETGRKRKRPARVSEEQNEDEGTETGRERKEARAEVWPKKRRKQFTTEQTELIKSFFQVHIRKREFPTSIECRDFVTLHQQEFQDRTVKDIYDKCRNIAGR